MPADELAASFVVAHGWISPWIAMVDDAKYQTEVTRIANLGIKTWVQTPWPCLRGRNIDRAMPAAGEVP